MADKNAGLTTRYATLGTKLTGGTRGARRRRLLHGSSPLGPARPGTGVQPVRRRPGPEPLQYQLRIRRRRPPIVVPQRQQRRRDALPRHCRRTPVVHAQPGRPCASPVYPSAPPHSVRPWSTPSVRRRDRSRARARCSRSSVWRGRRPVRRSPSCGSAAWSSPCRSVAHTWRRRPAERGTRSSTVERLNRQVGPGHTFGESACRRGLVDRTFPESAWEPCSRAPGAGWPTPTSPPTGGTVSRYLNEVRRGGSGPGLITRFPKRLWERT